MAPATARRIPPVRLLYLWDSQMVIAVNERGEVLAAERVARLIAHAPRRERPHLSPKKLFGEEIDAIRNAVIAEAQLAGQPAPEGWAHRIHGKPIHTQGVE